MSTFFEESNKSATTFVTRDGRVISADDPIRQTTFFEEVSVREQSARAPIEISSIQISASDDSDDSPKHDNKRKRDGNISSILNNVTAAKDSDNRIAKAASQKKLRESSTAEASPNIKAQAKSENNNNSKDTGGKINNATKKLPLIKEEQIESSKEKAKRSKKEESEEEEEEQESDEYNEEESEESGEENADGETPSDVVLYYNMVTTQRQPGKRRIKPKDFVLGQSDSESDDEEYWFSDDSEDESIDGSADED